MKTSDFAITPSPTSFQQGNHQKPLAEGMLEAKIVILLAAAQHDMDLIFPTQA